MMFGGGIPSSRHGISQGLLGGIQQWMPPRMGSQGMHTGSPVGGTLMSDERSKQEITRLRDMNNRLAALVDSQTVDGEQATEYPSTPAPDTDALDRSYSRELAGTSSNEYSYTNPEAPGAAPGRHVGPMSTELRGLPGVVERGPDGMDRVDPGRLALATASATGENTREIDDLRSRLDALIGSGEESPDAVLDRAYAR